MKSVEVAAGRSALPRRVRKEASLWMSTQQSNTRYWARFFTTKETNSLEGVTMKGQGTIAMPIARLLELAGAALRGIRKRSVATKVESEAIAREESETVAYFQGGGMYDSVWGGKSATGVYVVGRVDDGTYKFVCFL
jgi:hypothetical protein